MIKKRWRGKTLCGLLRFWGYKTTHEPSEKNVVNKEIRRYMRGALMPDSDIQAIEWLLSERERLGKRQIKFKEKLDIIEKGFYEYLRELKTLL